MKTHALLPPLVLAGLLVIVSGSTVVRGQETVGAYVDDSAITAAIKARFVDSRQVAASSISAEALNSTVMLSDFATSMYEKTTASDLVRAVDGVRSVQNQIVVRP